MRHISCSNDAPKALLEKIELVVRLIRSKGVGVYFVTQSPADIPDSVLGQLGNRVQHALRAFTRAIRRRCASPPTPCAPTRPSTRPASSPSSGWARPWSPCSMRRGRPCVVERAFIAPPASRIGPLSDAERQALIQGSVLHGRYETREDRRIRLRAPQWRGTSRLR